MTDPDPSVLWMHSPPTPTKPRPGESLWAMTKGARRLTCELHYHGEYGVETLVLLNGELYVERRVSSGGTNVPPSCAGPAAGTILAAR
jgi:hypothetical protein